MANNYLVTLASEQLYRAARDLVNGLKSTEYQDFTTIASADGLIRLQDALAQYRNLAYDSDWVVEMKAVPTEEI